MFEISADCFAKVNLALAITGRDAASGMHYIDSVIAKIKLKDVITVKSRRTKGVKVSFTFAPGVRKEHIDPADNTLTRTYGAVQDVLGIALPPLAVSIEKHIPVAGGLGGGSSDAAAFVECLVMLALAGELGDAGPVICEAEPEDWRDVALAVGMDTFFFMLSANVARVTGFGEYCGELVLPGLYGLRCAVIDPGVSLSTAGMYARVTDYSPRSHVGHFLQEWRTQAVSAELAAAGREYTRASDKARAANKAAAKGLEKALSRARNDFTNIARKASPEVAAVLHEYEGRFPYVGVTGSGSCVIVIGKPKAIRGAGLTPYRFLTD